uniref:Uncharacterized protein n=1 Tax=Arundo donax TaxID=35708 RepID=A0A0A9SEV3_ARUDO
MYSTVKVLSTPLASPAPEFSQFQLAVSSKITSRETCTRRVFGSYILYALLPAS